MSSDIYTSSIQLDSLITEKLKNSKFAFESSSMTTDQMKSEINTLRYLLYLANQDRLNLRQHLKSRNSLAQSISSKDSLRKSFNKDLDSLNYLSLYENTGNASDINTVVNTSILPYSCENTEREFSPFSPSPMSSPRVALAAENVLTAVLSTEVTGIRTRNKEEKNGIAGLEGKEEEFESEELDEISVGALNCSNYLVQLRGDDDDVPCGISEIHSRENSVNY